MVFSLKHFFVSAKADGPDSTLIQPSNWNEEHEMTMAAGKVLGRDTSGAGAVQELPIAVDPDGDVKLTSTTADDTLGPILRLLRASATPADDDLLAAIHFMGRNDAAADLIYAFIYAYINDMTAGTENGGLSIQTMRDGLLRDNLAVQNGQTLIYDYNDGAGLGPLLRLYRISASPTFNDLLGALQFMGRNSAADDVLYSFIYGYISDATAGTENGGIALQARRNGALGDALIVTQIRTYSTGGLFSNSPTSGVGYMAGAGGAVIQATSKTTGVTLNKVCGGITMNAAALGNDAIATFTVTCSAVEAADVPVVAVRSPSGEKYRAWVSAVAAGSFDISVQNVSGGALSEAVILNVGLLKGSLT